MAPSTALAQRVRDSGLRLTSQRLAVLAAIEEHPDHPDATEIAAAARRRVGSISTQAVYNVLEALTDAGLIRRIEPAGSPALYETRVGDNHHHVVCRSCGTTVDVACVVGHGPCLKPSSTHGFVVDEAEVTFWGLCRSCRPTSRAR
jgi:Fur family ferric uptake transcriptional regulator